MNTEPLISVALCTFNGAKHVEEQLKSILSQSYKNIEVIVVDDCSSDSTLSILEKYKTDSRVHIYKNENNLGYIKNFEKAISLCQGDFIALSDQDDIWELNKLETLLGQIKDFMLIYSDSEIVNEKGEFLNKKISSIRNFIKGHHPEAFLFHNCVAGHTCLFRRELKKYIFPFPQEIFHDWWIAFAASSLGEITFTSDCLVKYRQHTATNTDMLHLRTAKRVNEQNKSKKVELKTKEMISHLSVFYQFGYLQEKDKKLIGNLIEGYQKRLSSIFSFQLFLLLARNRKKIYFIPKDPFIYKAVHIFKESFGSKIKKAYYKWKEKKSQI